MRLTRDRRDQRTADSTRDHVFVITSPPADQASPAQLASYVRGHLGIESKVHRVRDVTFDEGRSQVRAGNAAPVMASQGISLSASTGWPARTASPRLPAPR